MKSLTQEQLDRFCRSWQKRAGEEKARLQQRYKKGRNLARQIAQQLVDRYDASQVYLIGSLVEKESVHETSDIDLVVRGLAADQYFAALAECYRMLSGEFHLDLIPYEDANELMKRSINEKAEMLAGTP